MTTEDMIEVIEDAIKTLRKRLWSLNEASGASFADAAAEIGFSLASLSEEWRTLKDL